MIDAAQAPRVASQDSPHREPGATHGAVHAQGGDGVRGARRVVPAARREPRGHDELVTPDQAHEEPGERVANPALLLGAGIRAHREPRAAPARARSRSCPSSALVAPAAGGSARTTSREPAGSAPSRGATSPRRRRLTRFRSTAPPTAFDTTKPTVVALAGVPASRWTTTRRADPRRPRRTVEVKSTCRRMRCLAGSTELLRPTARSGPCGGARR